MLPDISLEYSSADDNGVLGVGWRLRGLSVISRCGRTIAQDGYVRGVQFDTEDAFCLDGLRLVPIDVRFFDSVVEYRTEPDSNARIISFHTGRGHGTEDSVDALGSPDRFVVYDSLGRIRTYGGTVESAPVGKDGIPLAWYVRSVKDRYNNEARYSYENRTISDPPIIDIRPVAVEAEGPGGPTRIEFAYENGVRPDQMERFIAGVRLVNLERLRRIQTYVGSQLVRAYWIEYESAPVTGRSRLISVKECADNDVCKAPVRFTWQNANTGWDDPFVTNISSIFQVREDDGWGLMRSYPEPIPIDLNGDGRDDIVEFYPTGGFRVLFARDYINDPSFESWDYVIQEADVDRLPETLDGPGCAAVTFNAYGDGGNSSTAFAPYGRHAMPLDYNLDGRMDLLILDPTPTWRVIAAPAGSSFQVIDTGIPRLCPNNRGRERVFFLDLNGDGRKDMMECRPDSPGFNSWHYRLFGSNGWDSTARSTGKGGNCHSADVLVMDHDGDGTESLLTTKERADYDFSPIVVGEPIPYYAAIVGHFGSRRTGPTEGVFTVERTNLAYSWSQLNKLLLEVNGDGASDLVGSYNGTYIPRTGSPIVSPWDPGAALRVLDPNTNLGGWFEPRGPAATVLDIWGEDDASHDVVVDFNHDSRSDLLIRYFGCYLTFTPNFAGRFTRVQGNSAFEGCDQLRSDVQQFSANRSLRPIVFDHNGDGIADLLTTIRNEADDDRSSGGYSTRGKFAVRLGRGPVGDRIVSFRDSFNPDGECPTVEIEYAPITQKSFYESSHPCVYPEQCRKGGYWAVLKTREDRGPYRICRETRYDYKDLRSNLHGTGILGFLFAHAFRNNIEETNWEFDQRRIDDRPPSQLPTDVKRYTYPWLRSIIGFTRKLHLVDGRSILERKVNLYGRVTSTNGRTYRPILTRSARATEELGVNDATTSILDFVSVNNITTDSYGNPTEIITDRGDGYKTTQSITWENRIDSWLIGLQRIQTVLGEGPPTFGAPQTRITERTYNAEGAVETIVEEPQALSQRRETWLEYDSQGHLIRKKIRAADADLVTRERITQYEPNNSGVFLTAITDPAGLRTEMLWDLKTGQLAAQKDPGGAVTRWGYDGFGRFGEERRSDGVVVTETYLPGDGVFGNLFQIVRTESGRPDVTSQYDRLGWRTRIRTRVDGNQDVDAWFSYDSEARLTSETRLARVGTGTNNRLFYFYSYDNAGRPTQITRPDGTIIKWSYARRRATMTDARGKASVREFDGQGRLHRVEDAKGGLTHFWYGPFGRLIQVDNARVFPTKIEYNQLGQRTSIKDPNGGRTEWTYDGFGQLTSERNPRGESCTFRYDPNGRLLERDCPNFGKTTLEYDLTYPGRIYRVTSPDGPQTAFTYDAIGRTSKIKRLFDGLELDVQTGYDGLGRVATVTYPAVADAASNDPLRSLALSYDYDNLGNMVEIRGNGTQTSYWHAVVRDGEGRTTREYVLGSMLVSRTFDTPTGRLAEVGFNANGHILHQEAVKFDPNGNILTRQLQPPTSIEQFAYDALERLVKVGITKGDATPETFSYDALGNISQRSSVGKFFYKDAARPDALTAAGVSTFGYDAAGFQEKRPEMKLEYTAFGKIRHMKLASGRDRFFDFDGVDEIARQRSPDGQRYYAGDYYEGHRSPSGSWKDHRYFIYSPNGLVAMIVAKLTSSGKVEWKTYGIHTDRLGSIAKIVSSSGQELERRFYDPFGRMRRQIMDEANVPELRRSFTGHDSFGPDLPDLVNMGGRIYDARLARFLMPDPAGVPPHDNQGWNRYAYARNNPLRYWDPTGYQNEERHIDFSDVHIDVVRSHKSPGKGTVGAQSDFGPDDDRSFNPIYLASVPGPAPALGVSGWTGVSDFFLGVGLAAQEVEDSEHAQEQATFAMIADFLGFESAAEHYEQWAARYTDYASDYSALTPKTPPGKVGAFLGPWLQAYVDKKRSSTGVTKGTAKSRTTTPLTRAEARTAAKRLGFKPVQDPPFRTHEGLPVFQRGQTYISPDHDVHSGGTWKMLDKKGNRKGTYNADLSERIGP